jgi:F-type H+-transporting ATPase subunit b
MELDWTTFLLEIANFLILVWILQRFLYRPVLAVIAARRAATQRTLNEAATKESEAATLKARYETRLSDWAREKENFRAVLHDELAAERARQMAQLQAELAAEREKRRGLAERETNENRRAMERQALDQGGRFAARLLGRVSDAALDGKLVAMLIEDLPRLWAENGPALAEGLRAADGLARVTSARQLAETQREQIAAALEGVFGAAPRMSFDEDPGLISGISVAIGPWVLRANLRDELQGFAQGFAGEG